MKNIHVLKTDKPSRLFKFAGDLHLHKECEIDPKRNQNIYITSDVEIKEGDWCFNPASKCIVKADSRAPHWFSDHKKIILTTDQDLIKDGVQAIDDEFLEWFVKNPSCDEIEINYEIYKKGVGLITSDWRVSKDDKYKIIIPKEEPKQETLEERKWLPIFNEYVKDNKCNLFTFFNWLETNYNPPTKK